VKKSQASSPLALCSQELAPGWAGPPRSGPQTGPTKDSPDGSLRSDPELAKLALYPHAPPPRVLPAETENEIRGLGIEGRSPGPSPPAGPFPCHELAVPSPERLGRDHERALPRKGPARRQEECPVAVAKLRAPDRPTEDLCLVTENGVLDLEL
jgi:hypothetical protein